MKQILISLLAFIPLMSKADDVNVNGVHYYIKGDEAIAKRLLKGEIRKGALVIDSVVYHSGRAYPVTCIDMYSEEWGLKDSVTSVVIPNSVTEIRGFFRFKELTEVTIPNSVKIIKDAFESCSQLDSIYIPSSVDTIIDAFEGCSLNRIIVDKNNKVYDSRENCNCIISTATNSIVRGGNQSVIPSSVTSIDESAFSGCSIESIDIPSSVKYIGSYAFYGCGQLLSVNIPDSTLAGDGVFSNCPNLTSFNIPKGWVAIPSDMFKFSGLTSISIPDNIKQIGNGAFYRCDDMKTVKIPHSVEYIGDEAFGYCSELSSVIIPNSVSYMGAFVFEGCDGLTQVKLSSAIKAIRTGAFEDCYGLEEINIPYGVTEIANNAFRGCSLESLAIPATVKIIGEGAFSDCDFSTITIPSNVVEIGEGAFSGCENLSSLIVDKGNPRYDSRNNCNCIIETQTNTLVQGCKESFIPTTVKGIGPMAFYGVQELKSIEIPGSVTEIGNGAFSWCENLEHITIPNSVNTLHRGAFKYCGKLTEFTIPASVKTISPDIFDNCSHITDVYVLGYKMPEVETYRNSFPDWVQEATLHVPASLVDYYRSTKPWNKFGRIEALYEETTPVGQGQVGTDDDSVVNAYGIDGTVISDAKKGINVIQHQNGKVRKIIK
ncbi:MAG: leucine-rich repeat domain-containing protein [Bacteroidaceae bacterium]|nr:leucine-rich repeat domain-containing protein [Bacteroidaceae bacterium]